MSLASGVNGLHHITAISGPAQENLDFYAGILGMRLVKRSVNQDDPGTYHLFYADAEGNPGTDLTFFPWAQMAPPRASVTDSPSKTSLEVPAGSLDYWGARLDQYGVAIGPVETRFGDRVLPLIDTHGFRLALVESAAAPPGHSRRGTAVPSRPSTRFAVSTARGSGNATRTSPAASSPTCSASKNSATRERLDALRFHDAAGVVDIRETPTSGAARGASAPCTTWRGAWTTRRISSRCAARVEAAGATPTPVIDRFWFKSVYFREPGGVLFEIATTARGSRWTRIRRTSAKRSCCRHGSSPARPDREHAARRSPCPPNPIRRRDRSRLRYTCIQRAAHQRMRRRCSCSTAPAATSTTHAARRYAGSGSGLLSPRGQVLERGMPRFFRRLAEGVFDLDDLRMRTRELAAFVAAAATRYGFDPKANRRGGILERRQHRGEPAAARPGVLAGAILFRAMVPIVPDPLPALGGTPVFMSNGRTDPLIPAAEAERLAGLLRQAGAIVDIEWQPGDTSLRVRIWRRRKSGGSGAGARDARELSGLDHDHSPRAAAERDPLRHLLRFKIDNGKIVGRPVGGVNRLAVWRQREPHGR